MVTIAASSEEREFLARNDAYFKQCNRYHCKSTRKRLAQGLPVSLVSLASMRKGCGRTNAAHGAPLNMREQQPLDLALVGWVDQSNELLDPLVVALGCYALAGAKVHADDTPVGVLDPGRGRTKTGRLWVCVRDDRPAASQDAPAVWFQYSPDRKGEHPQTHLKNFAGLLQTDAYGSWGKLYGSGLRHGSCLLGSRETTIGYSGAS